MYGVVPQLYGYSDYHLSGEDRTSGITESLPEESSRRSDELIERRISWLSWNPIKLLLNGLAILLGARELYESDRDGLQVEHSARERVCLWLANPRCEYQATALPPEEEKRPVSTDLRETIEECIKLIEPKIKMGGRTDLDLWDISLQLRQLTVSNDRGNYLELVRGNIRQIFETYHLDAALRMRAPEAKSVMESLLDRG